MPYLGQMAVESAYTAKNPSCILLLIIRKYNQKYNDDNDDNITSIVGEN